LWNAEARPYQLPPDDSSTGVELKYPPFSALKTYADDVPAPTV